MKMVRLNKTLRMAALLAVILNALLPFYAISSLSSVQAAERDQVSSLFGDKILICTEDGFKWVTKEQLKDIDTEFDYGSHLKCPLCYVIAHGQSVFLPTDAAISFHEPVDDAGLQKSLGLFLTKSEITLSGHLSRAPPFLHHI